MGNPLLTVKNLSAWYDRGKMVLDGFSLELAAHEVVGLIGLNGAGKTTFLKILSGLLPSFRAENILFRGQPVNLRKRDFKTSRYTVFAEDDSFPYFTFREYLSYVCSAYEKDIPDVSELVHGFHFENDADTLLKDLSTGNRKKAFLITAFKARNIYTSRLQDTRNMGRFYFPPMSWRASRSLLTEYSFWKMGASGRHSNAGRLMP